MRSRSTVSIEEVELTNRDNDLVCWLACGCSRKRFQRLLTIKEIQRAAYST